MNENSGPLLEVKKLSKHFPIKSGVLARTTAWLKAVDNISFQVMPGETVGLVGESGCGKSTLGRTIMQLYRQTDGTVEFDGHRLDSLSERELQPVRRNIQMIVQDPFESLNSRQTVRSILEEPFVIHYPKMKPRERLDKVKKLAEIVGLQPDSLNRYPHEFSGGQRQRIGIARAIALEPKLVVCDEPVSALDVSIQSQILNLLLKLQKEMGLAYLFIAHDLAVVRHISDRVAVMYLGKIVEYTTSERIYESALHPYTQGLIAAIPEPDPELTRKARPILGELPSPLNAPSGCSFHPRCPRATEMCKVKEPELTGDHDHMVACHHPGKEEN